MGSPATAKIFIMVPTVNTRVVILALRSLEELLWVLRVELGQRMSMVSMRHRPDYITYVIC
jgi:hypothetical protein